MTSTSTIASQTETTARLYDEAKERLRLAEGLLGCLTEAHEQCETQLARLQKRDPVREVTGKSSIDTKIASTKRMVESLGRIVEELGARLEKQGACANA